MSGTLRDLLFESKSRCFECKNHGQGLGPMETSHSGANHAVLHAQNDSWCLGRIEISYSGPEYAVLHAKTTGWVLDPQRLLILVLKSLFCMHKTTGDGWNQYSLCVKHAVMCAQSHRWGLGHIETWNSGPNHAVFMHTTTGYVWDS